MCDFISKNKKLFSELDIFINSTKQSEEDLVNILHGAQNIFGYLPLEVQMYIGKKLSISLDKISDIINFYSYFATELEGKFKINVCLGNACSKNGSNEILKEFEGILNIKSGQTTNDLNFTLQSCRCLGVCRRPPIVSVNGKIYESVTLEHISDIINDCN